MTARHSHDGAGKLPTGRNGHRSRGDLVVVIHDDGMRAWGRRCGIDAVKRRDEEQKHER